MSVTSGEKGISAIIALTGTTAAYKKIIAFPYSCTIYQQVVKLALTKDGIKENPMNKLVRGCFALALILLFTTSADCKELTTYMSINSGVTLVEDADLTDSRLPNSVINVEYDPGYFIGLAIGNQVDKMRLEAEMGYQKNKVDSSTSIGSSVTLNDEVKVRLSTLLFNFYYDFKNGSRFTPYVCAGLGLGNIKLDGFSKSDAVGEYQFGAGMSYQITETVALDLKGRYLATTDAEFDTATIDFSTINAIFDIRIYF